MLQSFVAHIGSILSAPFASFSSLFGHAKASAATAQDYYKTNNYFDVNQWGWTPQEMDVYKSTDPFENAAQVEAAMKQNPDYYSKLEACYSPGRMLYQLASDPDCSATNLQSPQALQWRIYKLNLFSINQISSLGINENQ